MQETAKERTERLKGVPMIDIIIESHIKGKDYVECCDCIKQDVCKDSIFYWERICDKFISHKSLK